MILETLVRCATPVDLHATLGSLRRAAADPHCRWVGTAWWRAFRTPLGPVTLRLQAQPASGGVAAAAWGPGAEWALAAVPDLIGERDDPSSFVPTHPLLRSLHQRHPGLRVPRTGLVIDAVVPSVLEQRVTGTEARREWCELVRRHGEPAPAAGVDGVPPLQVMPAPETIARLPSWEWHRLGVDGSRSRTIVAACRAAYRLEQTSTMPLDAAYARLRAVPGIGAWTAAEVAQRAWGDADAVSVGDYHLAAFVGWAIAGRWGVDDDGMLELLEPMRPHRYRAIRLLELSGVHKPRFGPRLSVADHRSR